MHGFTYNPALPGPPTIACFKNKKFVAFGNKYKNPLGTLKCKIYSEEKTDFLETLATRGFRMYSCRIAKVA